MSEQSQPIKFWLKDKSVTGIIIASSPEEGVLAEYRGKLSVIKGETVAKFGAAIQFTRNTLPVHLKKAFGLVPAKVVKKSTAKPAPQPPEAAPLVGVVKDGVEDQVAPAATEIPIKAHEQPAAPATPPAVPPKPAKAVKVVKKVSPDVHTVECKCQCCSEIKLLQVKQEGERFEITQGRTVSTVSNPFFLKCDKCREEIAVRLVPVTTFIAQTAGFK